MVRYDIATDWLEYCPWGIKSVEHTTEAFKEWAGPRDKIQGFCCDNAPEHVGAAKQRGWRCAAATTGMPQNNGLVERLVRTSMDGGRCNIAQSGALSKWWPRAVKCYSFGHNVAMRDGDSPCNKRHKQAHCKSLLIPLGAHVQYMPQPDTKKEFV